MAQTHGAASRRSTGIGAASKRNTGIAFKRPQSSALALALLIALSGGCRALAGYTAAPHPPELGPDGSHPLDGPRADRVGPVEDLTRDRAPLAKDTSNTDLDGRHNSMHHDSMHRDSMHHDSAKPSCSASFNTTNVPSYLFCWETLDTCSFYYYAPITETRTCKNLCGDHACVEMKDNTDGKTCEIENPNSCSGSPCSCTSAMHDGICTCKR